MKKATLLLFMLLISVSSFAQFPEGFETWPPAGWTIINNEGPNVTWGQSELDNTNQPPYEGNYAAFLDRENVAAGLTEDLLVTPQFTVPAAPQLKFFSRLSITGDTGGIYEIRITTDPDPLTATYTTIQTWTETQINPSQTEYAEKIVNIPASYIGQQVYIAFVMLADFDDRWLIDNVNVVTQCLDPTTLTAANMSQTTAELSWANPSGATSWEIEVVPAASAPTGAGVVYNGSLPYTATGLTEGTAYKFYVRAICSPGNTSQWVGPFNFSTMVTGSVCTAPIIVPGLPYSTTDNTTNYGDDFDGTPGATGCGTTGNFLNGNEVVYAYTATFTGAISVGMTGNGANSAMFVYNSCANIGTSCVAGGTGNATTPVNLPTVSVIDGTTYYIVISSSTTQTTAYTLLIQQVNCPPPTNLSVSDQNATSANLSWNANGASSWEIVVQAQGAGVPAGAGTTTTVNTSYNATQTTAGVPFAPATAYEYYVRADCGTGDGTFSAWAGPFAFQTTQVPVTLPYTEGFEGTHGWSLNNGTQPVKWFVGTAVNNGGTQSMYVSNDNGVTNTYPLTGASSTVHAYRDVQLPSPVGQISLSFDWKSGGEGNWDYIRVWAVPVTFVPTPGTLITAANSGGTQIGGNFNLNHPNWTTANFVIDASAFQGQVRRIVFEWRNDGSGGTGVGGAVDNINIEVITCSSPSALAVSGITQTSATATWTAPGDGAASYDYYVSTSATAPTETTVPTGNVTTTTTPLTGLTASTSYNVWVRSNCDADGTSFWIGPVAFNTLCDAFNVPFYEGFNSDSTTEFCWTVINSNGDGDLWNMNYTTNPFEGNQSAMMYTDFNDGNNDDWLISPTINLTGNQRLKYHYRVQSSGEPNDFEVLLSTQGTDPVNFTTTVVPLATYNNTTYVEVIVNLIDEGTPISGPVNIAWHVPNGGLDGWRIYIDNVIIEDIPSCPDPTNLAVLSSTTTTAELSWNPGFNETAWQVVVQPQGTGAPTSSSTIIDAPTNPFTVTDLEPSTQYEYYVRANCAVDDQSNWVGPFLFTTQCDAFDVPFFEGFNISSTSEFCWTVVNANGDGDQWDMNYGINPYEGNQVAMLYTDFNGTNNDDWLISPTINLTGNQRLRYRYRVQSSGEPNNFEVKVSTTGTATTAFTTTLVPLATYNNTTYAETIVNITDGTDLLTGPVNIAWHVPPGGPDGWRIYIDAVIVEDIPACPEPLNLQVDCLSSTGANLAWEQGGTETEWEVAIVPAGGPAPTTGTIVDEMLYYAMNLTEGVEYTAYVRSVCPGEEGEVGAWVIATFTTPETSVIDAEGFCASDNPDQYILFDNVDDSDNAQEYGEVACLGSTPNPVWYYLQVEDAGQLNFQLIQNTAFDATGNPTGTALDVDFVAYGPFTSLNEACGQIELVDCPTCPFSNVGSTFYPFGNIIDCSYSAAAVENFTIPNAQTGEIYAVLITNFNGDPGQIKLQQLASSTGSTNCNILYNVSLGEDQILCGATETEITATVTTPGNSEAPTYEWFMDGNPFTPTVVSTTDLTQTIEVTELGSHIYSVVITVENAANTEPITDEVLVILGPTVDVPNPAGITLCGTGGSAQLDLSTLTSGILDTLNPDDYNVEYYLTEADAIAGVNPIDISVVFTTTTQTIYVRVESVVLEDCFDVVPLPISVGTTSSATIAYDGSPYCSNTTAAGMVTMTGTPGGTYTASEGLIIDPVTGEINIAVSGEGTYTVTYTIAESGSCPEFETTTTVVITPAPDATFTYDSATFCMNAINTAAPTFNGGTAGTFTVDMGGLTIDPATGIINPATSTEGVYVVTNTIPAADGCDEVTASVTVEIIEAPIGTFTYAMPTYCQDDAALTASPILDGVAGTFSATPAGLSINPSTGVIDLAASQPGTYTVTNTIAQTEQCDEVSKNTTVVISGTPGIMLWGNCEDSVFVVRVTDVDNVLNPDNVTYSWTGPEGFTAGNVSYIEPDALGEYYVTITTPDGCTSTLPYNVETTSCLVQKGISPGDEGKNNTFDLTGLNVVRLSIFNRYGQEVFSYGNYTNQWGGQDKNGNELPTGTYFFSFERANGETKTGWIYVNRQN